MNEFPCPGPITVDLRAAGGSVEIHAEPRETATVEVAPEGNSDADREAAAATRVDLLGDRLLIAAPEHTNWLLRRPPRLRITARVPAGSTGKLRTASADLRCTGEWAQIRAKAISGDVSVEHSTGDLVANTASGDLQAERVDGQLTVRTASGDVVAGRVGRTVDVSSASGHVRIDHAGGDVRVKSASGNTRIGAIRQGTVRANTVSGNVSIGVVAGTGVWLDLNTVAGKTVSDLTMGAGADEPSHDLTVQVRTVSGNIDVHRVTPAAATT